MATIIFGDDSPAGTAAPGSEIVATGATTSSWVERDFNVLAFGAVGDGTTDDTAAIQAAINNGGVVVLPPTPHGYLLNSAPLTLTKAGTVLVGGGAENTKLLIGAGFTGSAAVLITAYNCQVQNLSISGASSTTTSNPVADAIRITGARRAKVDAVTFFNVNGWCVNVQATNASSTSNPLGTVLTRLFGSSCAGGIHFLGNATQNGAVNSQISNCQFATGGVTTGASANLDGLMVEDAWDVLIENTITWMSVGTGSALHVKGHSAATFVTSLDALGPTTGPCVLIEDGPNGSPQNVQILGGVIQQGSPGVLVTGGASQVHIQTSRIINNTTHGIQIAGTNTTIFLTELFFSLNGAGAAGTNYDLNWSGTAVGYVTGCRFATPVVSSGTAGVQNVVNVASAGQNVRVIDAAFLGTGASSANWFTNVPSTVTELSSGAYDLFTGVIARGNLALQPSASGNTIVSGNVNGSDAFDRFRLLVNSITMGGGSAARDAQIARTAAGLWVVSNPATAHGAIWAVDGNVLVGATAALGDNGVGEVQIANASTVPSTNPTGGGVLYAQAGALHYRGSSGTVTTVAVA